MVISNLNEGENSFRSLAENLPGIVYRVLIEDDNRMIFFNDMVQTMTGYSPEELKKGKVCSIDPLILPEDRINVISIVKDAIEKNVPFEVEYRIINKSGELKWFFERGRPIRGDKGNPSYIDGVIFDITDRKEAENKLKTSEESLIQLSKELEQKLDEEKIGLRESEKKFKTIFDESPICIELYDSNGKLVDINESCLDIFGVSSIDDVADFDLFKDPNIPKEQLKKLKKGQVIRLEILFDFDLVKELNLYETTKSGKIWIDLLISPIYLEENSTVSNYLVQIQDITERKIAEQKLKALNKELDNKVHERTKQLKRSEEQHKRLSTELETILDNYPGLAFYKDTNNNFIRINQKLVDYYNSNTDAVMANLTKRDIEGKNLSDLLPKDIAQAYWEDDLEVIKSGTPKLNIEDSFKTEHGIRLLNSHKIPDFDEIGEVRGIIGFSIDITESKKSEQKLKESEEKYRLITENVNDLIFVVNQNMNYEFVNEKAYLNIMGRTKEEMIGKSALSWIHPEDVEKSIEAFKNGFEKGEGRVEARFKDKKGIYHWFEVKGKTFTDHDGKKKALMISRDTTQHKKAQQKIIQEREKANLYLNLVEVILVALDRDGKITLINKKGHELLGYNEGELIGKNWFEVCLPPHDRERVYEYFKKLMAGDMELVKFYENPIQAKNGENKLISWSTVLFKDKNGNITGLLSSGVDITERAITEQKLIESAASYKYLSNELEVILDHIPGVVVYKDTENNILRVNKYLADSHNLKKAEMENRSSFDLYPRDLAQAYWEDDLEVINSKTPKMNIVEPWETEDGRRWVNTSKIPYIDVNGNVKGIIAIAFDITERMLAEQKLISEKEKAQNYLDIAGVIIVALNADQTVQLINQKGCEILEEEESEIVGMNWFDNYIPEDVREQVKKDFNRIMSGEIKALENYENEVITKYGKKRIIAWHNHILENKAGQIIGTLSSGEDITKRMKAEKKLKESEKKYRTLIETAQEGIWTIDENSITSFVNPKMAEMLGYAQEEMLGKHIFDFMDEKGIAIANRNIELRKQGIEEHPDYEFLRKNGRRIYVLLEMSLLKDEEGNYKGVVAFVSDITERRKGEEEIKESEARFKGIFESKMIGTLFWDENGDITDANDTFLDIVGYTRNELLSGAVRWSEMTPPEYKEQDDKVLKEIATMGVMTPVEKEYFRKDGSRIPIILGGASLPGPTLNGVAFVLGITARKKAEAELKESEDQFRKQNIFLNNILESLTHPFYVINIEDYTVALANSTASSKGLEHGHYCYSLTHNRDTPCIVPCICPLDEVKKTKKACVVEHIHYDKEGNENTFEIYGYPILDEEGNVVQMIEYTLNITDRKTAQNELKKSEEKYRHLFENSPYYIILLDNKGNFMDCNNATVDIYGYPKEDFLGKNFKEMPIIPLEIISSLENRMEILFEGKRLPPVEFQANGKDGKKIWIDSQSTLIKLDNEFFIYIIGQDITERKKAEQKIKESEENYRDLASKWQTTFDAMSECVFLLDLESNILQCNKVALDFLGKRDYNEIIGHPCLEVVHGPSPPEDRCPMMRMKESNRTETSIAQIENKWCEISANPIFNDEGKLIGAVEVIADITERVKAEKDLLESEERFRNLIEQSVDGIVIVNEYGLIIEWTKSQEQITGLKREDVLEKPIWDIQFQAFPERDKKIEQYEMLKGMIEDVLKSGKAPWIGKLRDLNITRADNKKNRIIRQLPFLIKTQDKIMLCSFSRDITEQKQIQKENQEKQATLESIFRAAPTGIGMVKNRVLTQVNERFCNIVGYTQNELLNKSARIVYPSDEEYELVGKVKYTQIGQYGIGTVETKFLRKDGKTIDVLLSSVPMDLNDLSIGVTFTALDITERKKVERKLIESEEKFRTIAERTFMGILIIQDDYVKYANDALLNMFEYSQKEIINWKKDGLTKLIDSDDLPFLREYLEHLRSGEKSFRQYYSYRVITKSGKKKWIDQFSKEILYRGSRAELITIMDITEKKEAEQELVKLNSMKSELLRRTSHELKTPLVSIKGFSDLLLELHRDKMDDYVIRTIEQIRMGCSRLESLVNDILKTSELESGSVELKKSNEDLSLLIKVCISELEGLTELRNHTINLELSDNLICSFEKKQIYNVITNILSNAIKYTPFNGKIEIKSEITDGFIITSISDNGIGFSKEEKTQIFKRFGKIERYGQGYDVISEGSGLGLYISKKIIEMHDGEIWVESEGREKGSTFYFSLPRV